jgi:hypothetical protein
MDQQDRISELEERIERLEGAVEAFACLMANRAAVYASETRPPHAAPSGLAHWEFYAFSEAVARLPDHYPAAAASPRAQGFEFVERLLAEALHVVSPPKDQ